MKTWGRTRWGRTWSIRRAADTGRSWNANLNPGRLLALFLVLCAACGAGLWPYALRGHPGARLPPDRAKSIVIGVDNVPPLYFVHSDGTVTEMAVDVMNEAARQLGYTVVWRGLIGQSDTFLRNHTVDMWPALSITAPRRKVFHLTDPWLHNTFCLLSLAGNAVKNPRAAAGRRVGYPSNMISNQLARRYLSKSTLVPISSRPRLMQAVCVGELPAAFIETRNLEPLILARPPGCESAHFEIHPVDGAEMPMGIASTFDKAPVADAFLGRITAMSEDGTLDGILGRWSVFHANESRSVVALRVSERRNRVVLGGLLAIVITAIALFWQVRIGRKTAAELRREMGTRRQAEETTRYALEQMEHQAYHDPLTGLANRLMFDRSLRDSLALGEKAGARVGLLYLDLDRFKAINDSLGHAAGDILLREAAQRLTRVSPGGSTLARMGGDEFAFLLPGIPGIGQAEAVARRVSEELSLPFVIEGSPWHCPASIGLSLYPDDAQSAAVLQRNADTALYRAKRTHRGHCVTFAPYMIEQAERSLLIEKALRRAMDKNAFTLAYQPQYSVDGALCGFEALLRLTDPVLGPLGPAEFIIVAEDIGLIVPIGEWALREACIQSVQWMRDGFPAVSMAVNVSPIQLTQCDFPALLRDVLAATGMPARLLEIELTETAVFANSHDVLVEMKDLGVRIAVDDFGTGYSSLSRLHNLPVDCVKIDRSFVREAAATPGSLPFIRTIVSLARSLGMKTVAEGVETPNQMEAVTSAGCDIVQGYLLSLPLTRGDATRLQSHFSPEPSGIASLALALRR